MKYIFIVPDGAADYPIDALNGKTPLEVADISFLNKLAKKGVLGRVKTVPAGFVPSSDVANLALMGYSPQKYYCARGPMEAANLGIDLNESDLAFRCNLITQHQEKILDYSAGHINDKEAGILIDQLNKKLGDDNIEFFPGKSYRHILVLRNGALTGLDKLKYYGPHDIMGKEIKRYLPKGTNSKLIVDLMLKSQEILKEHEINKVRIDLGENPANMIWLWSCGKKPDIPSFKDQFKLSGAVISAVDLIKGLGRIIGMDVIDVPGANGYYDTNYIGKAQAAVKALETCDLVFVHIEATDEAGHNNDLRMKIACLERIDKFVVGTIVNAMEGQQYKILICPDHPTPVEKRTHTDEPVPFVLAGTGIGGGIYSAYSEIQAASSNLYFERGEDLMRYFIQG